VTVVCLVAAYPVSYVLTRVGAVALRIIMVLVLLPLWTSILVRTYAWMVLLQANGVLNNLLRRLHVIDEPLRLMYNETGVVIETQVVDLLDWSLASAVAMVLLVVTVVLVIGFDRLLGLDKVWV